MRIAVICSIPGTGLSSVVRKLEGVLADAHFVDVEREICESLTAEERAQLGLPPNESASMVDIVSLPRTTSLAKWRSAMEGAIADLHQSGAAIGVLSLHLTWLNASTNEFFSPVVNDLLGVCAGDDAVVINLFDDVYDTLDRLSGDQLDIFHPSRIAHMADLLAPVRFGKPATDEPTKQHLVLDTQVSMLTSLLAWRRAETVQAEHLAREIGASFHPFAVKHTVAALANLVRGEPAGAIYLSHKISDPRRANKDSAILPDDLGTWPPSTAEVNLLHQHFARAGRVLINPTAIDELRFQTAVSRTSRDPYLSGRWPLVADGDPDEVCWTPSANGPEFTRLLEKPALLPLDAAYASAIGNLESRIYFEIPYRDHTIVVNTPHLLVYRPFTGAKPVWSGGVGPEVRNWRDCAVASSETRRALFVHTRQEIAARLGWLLEDGTRFASHIGQHVTTHLGSKMAEEQIPDDVINRFLSGHLEEPPPSHLAQRPIDHIGKRMEEIRAWFDSFCLSAMTAVFTSVDRRPTDDPFTVALMLIETDANGSMTNIASSTQTMSEYFVGELAVDRIDEPFWTVVEDEFTVQRGTPLPEAVREHLNLPFEF